MVSPKRKSPTPKRSVRSSSASPRRSSVQKKFVEKAVKCNNRVVKKEKPLNPKSLKAVIDSKLKPKAETQNGVGFGAQLKGVLADLATQNVTVPALYKKPLDAKGCYILLGNYDVDVKGDLLNETIRDTHFRYCNAIYPDEIATRKLMCDPNSTLLLPDEFNQLNADELALVRSKCDDVNKHTNLLWSLFSLGFDNETEKSNYIDTVERYLANPILDPSTNKPWKKLPNEAGLPWNQTQGFQRFYRLAGPYLAALQAQFIEIINRNQFTPQRNQGESDADFEKRTTKERNLIYDYLNNEIVCRTSDKYDEILRKVSLFTFYKVQIESLRVQNTNDTANLQYAFQ